MFYCDLLQAAILIGGDYAAAFCTRPWPQTPFVSANQRAESQQVQRELCQIDFQKLSQELGDLLDINTLQEIVSFKIINAYDSRLAL